MKAEITFPNTLQEAVKFFANEDVAFDFMKAIRWPTGEVTCPRVLHVAFRPSSTALMRWKTLAVHLSKTKHFAASSIYPEATGNRATVRLVISLLTSRNLIFSSSMTKHDVLIVSHWIDL